jgi:Holliday junction DNA helicase RuvA
LFDRIAGEVVHRSPTRVVIQTAGVGYEMEIPVSTYEKVPPSGRVELLTHLYVREDQMKIFGFGTHEERSLFRMLLSVSGVGPSIALAILSGSNVSSFVHAVKHDDVGFLSSVKGIGKKRAQRILVELKDAVEAMAVPVPDRVGPPGVAGDALEALMSLGYRKNEAEKAVQAAMARLPEDANVEEIIRASLGGARQ